MKNKLVFSNMAIALFLSGCTVMTVRDDSQVLNAVEIAGRGSPVLPKIDDAYLDEAWFAETLTLERAVQASMLNNPVVRKELTRLDIVQAERVQAGLLSNPMLDLMVLRPDGGGLLELNYALMQSLFDLFARSRKIAIADAIQERIQAEVIWQLVLISQNTESAYYDVLVAKRKLLINQQLLALKQSELTLLNRLADQGTLSSKAILLQQSDLLNQARVVQIAESEMSDALSLLAEQIGLESSKKLKLPEQLPKLESKVFDEPALQLLALKYRSELQISQASINQAVAEKNLETGGMRTTDPSVGIAGMRAADGMQLLGVAAKIKLPLFDTGKARIAKTDANVSLAEFQDESIRRLVPLQVERAVAVMVSNNNALDYSKQHVKQLQALEYLAQRNYQQGIGDYVELLQAQKNHLVAELEQVQSQWLAYNSWVNLERATGVAIYHNQRN